MYVGWGLLAIRVFSSSPSRSCFDSPSPILLSRKFASYWRIACKAINFNEDGDGDHSIPSAFLMYVFGEVKELMELVGR